MPPPTQFSPPTISNDQSISREEILVYLRNTNKARLFLIFYAEPWISNFIMFVI